MTIAAAYLVSEGVVFGADSATTVMLSTPHGEAVAQLFNHAQKVFEFGQPGESRLALCTWGAGAVGTTSHRTIAARNAESLSAATTVKQAVDSLVATVSAEVALAKAVDLPVGSFGYFVGGWDPKTHDPDCYKIEFQNGAPQQPVKLNRGQVLFEGAPELFTRAYWGVDPKFLQVFLEKLKQQLGPTVPEFDTVVQQSVNEAMNAIPHGGLPDMPIREAIDFVHMYLHLTIKGFKFRFGPALCGGPIEIGFVSTDRPFRWVRHKRFDTAIAQEEMGQSW